MLSNYAQQFTSFATPVRWIVSICPRTYICFVPGWHSRWAARIEYDATRTICQCFCSSCAALSNRKWGAIPPILRCQASEACSWISRRGDRCKGSWHGHRCHGSRRGDRCRHGCCRHRHSCGGPRRRRCGGRLFQTEPLSECSNANNDEDDQTDARRDRCSEFVRDHICMSEKIILYPYGVSGFESRAKSDHCSRMLYPVRRQWHRRNRFFYHVQ